MTINLSDLNTLVAAGESQVLELKKSTAEKDRASPTLCALANGVGRWETLPALGCGVDSLDSREIVVTLEEAIRRGRVEDPGTRDPLGILRGLGLLVQGEQLSRAAVALFCKDDIALPEFPQFSLRVARFRGTSRDEFLDNRQYAGNAFALMRRARWRASQRWHYQSWNPWIAKVFHRRGLIETWGRGTLKMAGLMQEAGLQPPTVAAQGDCVVLTFRLAQSLGGGSEKTPGKTSVIGSEKSSEKSSEKVLNLLQANGQLSAKSLAGQLGISSRAVEKQIDLLKKSGRLARIGPAKGGYWKVLSNE